NPRAKAKLLASVCSTRPGPAISFTPTQLMRVGWTCWSACTTTSTSCLRAVTRIVFRSPWTGCGTTTGMATARRRTTCERSSIRYCHRRDHHPMTTKQQFPVYYTRRAAMLSCGTSPRVFVVLPHDGAALPPVVQALFLNKHAPPAYGIELSNERKSESHIRLV